MAARMIDADTILNQAKPLTHQHRHEIHPYGHIVKWFVAEHVVDMPLVQAVQRV